MTEINGKNEMKINNIKEKHGGMFIVANLKVWRQ